MRLYSFIVLAVVLAGLLLAAAGCEAVAVSGLEGVGLQLKVGDTQRIDVKLQPTTVPASTQPS